MASTYTAAGIELITTGEQSGTWGTTTNTNWELVEELATGVVSVALTGTTYTLTTSDGSSSEGRHAVVVFSGSPGGTCTVTISPNDMQKVYFVKNGSDETVTLTQGSGGNVNVAAGDSAIVYCDGAGAGAAVVDFTSTFNFAAYADTTANFTGTLQNGGSNVVVDSDIGSTVQAYDADTDADTTKNDVANTFTADQTIQGELIADSYNEKYTAVTSTSNATTVDCEAGNTFMHTLTENTTFTFSNPPASGTAYTMSIEIIQDSTPVLWMCLSLPLVMPELLGTASQQVRQLQLRRKD